MNHRRHGARVLLLVGAFVASLAAAAAGQTPDVIGEVRVHGNHTTPDADILAIAGLAVGAGASDATLADAARRLEQSRRFDNVDVRKRYRSIDNPSDILVIILVDEVTGISADDLTPGPLKKIRSLGMWLPVLDYADGYGFTYGARITFVDTIGKRSRISVPLTWGGERRAAVDVDRAFERGPFSRIEGAAAVTRRVNPHFEVSEVRQEIRARAERTFTSWLRAGGGARLTNVEFGGVEQRYVVPAVDVTLDTRTDPGFPRNAIHAAATIERLQFDGGTDVTRLGTDVRGYVGLFGSAVLALRAHNIYSADPIPPFEQALLGGTANLRGFDFGYRAGDNLAAFSAELRVPLTSPLFVGKFGVKGFFDAGTVYASGEKLREQAFDRGVGGGVFMSWAVVRMGLDVAWPISTASNKPRWHFGLGVTF
jgi:outer membrane translocation and assembly module TamA